MAVFFLSPWAGAVAPTATFPASCDFGTAAGIFSPGHKGSFWLVAGDGARQNGQRVRQFATGRGEGSSVLGPAENRPGQDISISGPSNHVPA